MNERTDRGFSSLGCWEASAAETRGGGGRKGRVGEGRERREGEEVGWRESGGGGGGSKEEEEGSSKLERALVRSQKFVFSALLP